MLATPKEVEFLNVQIHIRLLLLALVYIGLAVWEGFAFNRLVLKREIVRIKNIHKDDKAGSNIMVKLQFGAAEHKSLFDALDNDNSGIVDVNEIGKWIMKHSSDSFDPDIVNCMDSLLQQGLGDEYHTGVTMDKFVDLLTTILVLLLVPHKKQNLLLTKLRTRDIQESSAMEGDEEANLDEDEV
mmetsp:Transcript_3871/g.9984  ORF Transcript_3871/g.9984 Transcript_3871/m.9984 type:complete len:184 (-) Transcript_3871:226-777(-)